MNSELGFVSVSFREARAEAVRRVAALGQPEYEALSTAAARANQAAMLYAELGAKVQGMDLDPEAFLRCAVVAFVQMVEADLATVNCRPEETAWDTPLDSDDDDFGDGDVVQLDLDLWDDDSGWGDDGGRGEWLDKTQ